MFTYGRPVPIQAPKREPGDGGNKRHPAIHAAQSLRRVSVGRRQAVRHVAVPRLAPGASMPQRIAPRASMPQRIAILTCRRPVPIQAPGASPGTAGTNATPLSIPPRVCAAFRQGVARLSAASQSPGSRRGLFMPNSPPARAGGFYSRTGSRRGLLCRSVGARVRARGAANRPGLTAAGAGRPNQCLRRCRWPPYY